MLQTRRYITFHRLGSNCRALLAMILKYSGTSLLRSCKMRTPPSTGHHRESSCFCFVCFCQINLGGASGLDARMAIITLHYIVFVSTASTTREGNGPCLLWRKSSG